MPGTKITSHAGNEKAWVWTSVDFADEEQKIEMFAIRFGTIEKAAQFKEEYEKAMDANGKLLAADVAEGGEEVPAVKDEAKAAADSAADALADEVAKTDV